MDKYADTRSVIENMAKVKMAMNSHKGDIEDSSVNEIRNMLSDEITELFAAEEIVHVIEEAADVQNFLLALVHKKIEEYRNRK